MPVSVRLNQQQIELVDQTIERMTGVSSREELLKRALREYHDELLNRNEADQ